MNAAGKSAEKYKSMDQQAKKNLLSLRKEKYAKMNSQSKEQLLNKRKHEFERMEPALKGKK